VSTPGGPETKGEHLRVRVGDAEREQWEAQANAAGLSLSAWIREQLNGAVAGAVGGIHPEEDRDFGDALDRLRIRYAHRRPADAIRMAVVTFRALLDEAGIDPVALLDAKRAALPGGPKKKG
jgi:hypothetical protein